MKAQDTASFGTLNLGLLGWQILMLTNGLNFNKSLSPSEACSHTLGTVVTPKIQGGCKMNEIVNSGQEPYPVPGKYSPSNLVLLFISPLPGEDLWQVA